MVSAPQTAREHVLGLSNKACTKTLMGSWPEAEYAALKAYHDESEARFKAMKVARTERQPRAVMHPTTMQPAGETIDLTLGGATTSGIATHGSGHSTPGATATPSSFRLKQSQLDFKAAHYKLANEAIAMWMMATGIPFNVVRSPYFPMMVAAIAACGAGYKPLNCVIFQQLHGPMQWAVALLECMLCMEGEKKISVNNVTYRSVEPHEQTHSRVRCPLCMCSTKMH